jgi:hypothetical protein
MVLLKIKRIITNVVNNCKLTTIISSRIHGKVAKVTIDEQRKGCLGSF